MSFLKCIFVVCSKKYLGFTMHIKGISLDPAIVKAI